MGIESTLFQAFGQVDCDAGITPSQQELDALAAIEAAIQALDVSDKEKTNLSNRITALLELLKQREQKIFDTGVTLAIEACKRMHEGWKDDEL